MFPPEKEQDSHDYTTEVKTAKLESSKTQPRRVKGRALSDNKLLVIWMRRIVAAGSFFFSYSEERRRFARIKMQSDIDHLSQFEVNSL